MRNYYAYKQVSNGKWDDKHILIFGSINERDKYCAANDAIWLLRKNLRGLCKKGIVFFYRHKDTYFEALTEKAKFKLI